MSAAPSGSASVMLHYCNIEGHSSRIEELTNRLSVEEQQRARRFHRDSDRLRFCVGRSLLRKILSAQTNRPPRSITIRNGSYGKPYVDGGPWFNLSHSGPAVLVGISQSGEIGVDIELVKPLRDLDELAQRCFSPRELESLERWTGFDRTRAFFRAWTRKEAFVKALGGGLSIDLKSFSVSLDDVTGNVLLGAPPCPMDLNGWGIQAVPVPAELVAAVALQRRELTVEIIDHDSAFAET